MRCLRDKCGIATVVLVYAILLLCSGTIIYINLTAPWSQAGKITVWIIFGSILSLVIASHSSAILVDPGYLKRGQKPLDKEDPQLRWCVKCKSTKTPKAHHCSVCNRCVVNMDHHCPWVNNCVGIYSAKSFILFNLYTHLFCLLSIVLIIARVVVCNNDSDNITDQSKEGGNQTAIRQILQKDFGGDVRFITLARMRLTRTRDNQMNIIGSGHDVCTANALLGALMLCVGVLAITFGCFTFSVLFEVGVSVCRGRSAIDRLKGEEENGSPPQSWRYNLKCTMGGGPWCTWLIPYVGSHEAMERLCGFQDRALLRH